MDVYAAFDFVVSADHMVDWVYPDSCKSDKEQRANRTSLRKSEPILRVVHHLANGAKHFKAYHHKSVDGVDTRDGPFDPEFFDSSFDTGDLIVELSDDDSTALGAKTLSILQLAEATIVYWEKKIRP